MSFSSLVISSEIFSGLSNKDLDKKDNATGIQLLGLILANGFHPIDRDSDIDEDRSVTLDIDLCIFDNFCMRDHQAS